MTEILEMVQKILAYFNEMDAVNVIENVDGDNVVLTLVVAEDDTGMVIGRHGRIAKAIRQIMKAAASPICPRLMTTSAATAAS